MAKTIFDYESADDLNNDEKQVGQKRNKNQQLFGSSAYVDRLMMSQKQMVEDIEKHCKNKRLKKNMFKMDFNRLGHKFSENYPSNVHATDPVVEYYFKTQNVVNYQHVMRDQSEKLLQQNYY